MGDPLAGHAILIAEPGIDPFVFDLHSALQGRGAETLAVREPPKAIGRKREFCFSARVVDCSHPSDPLHTLISDLSDIPVLLYGGEGASVASTGKVPISRSRTQAWIRS
jgi:hypothetical protein